MNYLCIDYGLNHTGLAIATTSLAEPVVTVPTAQAFDHISQLIKDHHLTAVVVGISEGTMAQKTRDFAQKIDLAFNLPIIFQDETLSSQETRRQVAQSGLKKSKREAKIDHLVAAHILQEFLDSQDNG